MATYYVDPAATGDNDGTTWANAWETFQRAIDGTGGTQPTAGDVILCRGTETVSSQIDSDGNSGTVAGGFVTYRGVNSSGTNDGTRFVLDANDNAIDILKLSADHIRFENLELHNTSEASGQNGVVSAGYANSDNIQFINCYIHNCYDGFNIPINGVFGLTLIKCRIENNANNGFISGNNCKQTLIACHIKGNGNYGFGNFNYTSHFNIINCVIIENGATGVIYGANYQKANILGNVISDNTGHGVWGLGYSYGIIMGNRITDNNVGINLSSTTVTALYNYIPDTGEDKVNTTKTTGGIVDEIYISGSNSNDFSGTDTDGGYEDSANDDYNLASDASMRRIEIDLEE